MTSKPIETITIDEFHARLKAQGVRSEQDLAFICPICETVQSARDLIVADAGQTFEEVEKYLAFTCVGRFTDAGPHRNGDTPGKGCDWTLGGLFQIHKLQVETPDGKQHPRFQLATPEQARVHAAKHAERAA